MKKENFSEKQLLSRKDLKKVLGGDFGIIDIDCAEGERKEYCPGGFIGADGVYHQIMLPRCLAYDRTNICGDGSGGNGPGGGGTEPGTTT
jgi:hypothetical protein